MATVTLDLLNSDLSEDDNGKRTRRRIRIEDVTGNADQRLNNALTDAAVPARGDAHPEISGIVVLSKTVTAIDATSFNIDVNYGPLKSGEIEDEQTAAVATILDKRLTTRLGERKVTRNRVGTDIADNGAFIRTVAYEESLIAFRFSRVETSIASARTLAVTYLGHLNSAIWSGDAINTWRMVSMEANPIQGRSDGAVRSDWEMLYRAETWEYNERRFFVNNTFLTLPSQDIYPEVDFAGLIASI